VIAMEGFETFDAAGTEGVTDVRTQEMFINMGPQHPSTHGVLRVLLKADGEVIAAARPYVGYIHRCAEKIGEVLPLEQFTPYTDRYDYLSAMNNNLGYCLAVEKLCGIEVPERAQYIRVIVAELNRIASHLVAFGTYGLDLGAFTPFCYAFRDREWILSLFERLCGARLTYNYVCIGGVRHDLPEGFAEGTRNFCDHMEKTWKEYDTLLTRNPIFLQRTAGIGVVSPGEARAWGFTGPCLRGSGVAYDLRRARPYLVYDKLDFEIPTGKGEAGVQGDCWDRYYVRMLEILESIKIVRQCLDVLPGGEVRAKVSKALKAPEKEVYLGVENPRGELGHYIVGDGKKAAYRMRVRGPSFANLTILGKLLEGAMIADAVAIIGSLDIVLGEVDR